MLKVMGYWVAKAVEFCAVWHSRTLILLNLLLAATGPGFAATGGVDTGDWHSGDIILLPLNCYSCQVLEDETGAPFSHSGVVLKHPGGEWVVAEALGDVHTVSPQEFLSRSEPGQSAVLMRSQELQRHYLKGPAAIEAFEKELWEVYSSSFQALGFDHEYAWDNFDQHGLELLYCSEFISKILNHFLQQKILPAAMNFRRHPDFWRHYFHGRIPEGQPGNSPASFSRSNLFFQVRIFPARHRIQ